jgi:hypothetical protein
MGALRVLLGAGCRDSDSMLRGTACSGAGCRDSNSMLGVGGLLTFAVCLMAKMHPIALPAGFSERISGCGGPHVRTAQFAVQHVPRGMYMA